MSIRKKISDHYNEIIVTVLIIFSIFLLAASAILLKNYSENLNEQAVMRVEGYTYDTGKRLIDGIDNLRSTTLHMSEEIPHYKSEDDIIQFFMDAKKMEAYKQVLSIRFFKDGVEYYDTGSQYDYRESTKITSQLKNNTEGKTVCVGVIFNQDRGSSGPGVAFYAPVKGSEFMDAVVLVYPIGTLVRIFDNASTEKLSEAELVTFCDVEGRILSNLQNHTETIGETDNVLDYLRVTINNKEIMDEIQRCMLVKDTTVFPIKVGGIPYIVSIGGCDPDSGGFSVIALYKSSNIYGEDYAIVSTIISILLIIFSIIILASLYFFVARRLINRRIYEASDVDPTLGCYTVAGFQRACEPILKRHKVTKFAIVIVEVRFYSYIAEHFGAEVSADFLKFLKYIYHNALTNDEVMGYFSNGQFYLMLHYRDEEKLISRLENIKYNVSSYPRFKQSRYALKLTFGVYEIDRTKNETLPEMMEKAVVAQKSANKPGQETLVKVYSDSVRQNYVQNADVESKADFALNNNEFQVFYQPKIDTETNRIDSSEALVRWYNPETGEYRVPDTFIPLFESNGFIQKLDRYVYRTVCEFISTSVNSGTPVVPVSINVSRVTASHPEFLDEYIAVKREFNIPKNFITLEFTESFAFENYAYLRAVVDKMHENGFLCSTDDFGTGSSAHNFLKQLDIDEIKLDRFFITKGISMKRDNIILKSTIDMARELNLKVVQEGVETEDDVRRLMDLGCHIIQGYYFSKPLSAPDYIEFIQRRLKKK